MKPLSLAAYGRMIRSAKTKEKLEKISYGALKNDPECTVFSNKYNEIIRMCIKREIELGL